MGTTCKRQALRLSNRALQTHEKYMRVILNHHSSWPDQPVLRSAKWDTRVGAARASRGTVRGERVAWVGWEQARDRRQETIGGEEGLRAGNWGRGVWTDSEPTTRECVETAKNRKGWR